MFSNTPRVIPTNQEDKVTVDSMLERMKKVQEYDEKIKHLDAMREQMIVVRDKMNGKISTINALITDFQRLRDGIK